MVNRIEQLVTSFYEDLWNRWDDDAVDEVLSSDFTFRASMGDETSGPSGWRNYRDKIRAASPDFHNEIVDLVVQGESAAARLLYTGRHHGLLGGIQPTGRRFEYAGAAFFESASGHLTRAWVLGDLAGLRRQLQD